ncbi:MAG: hypothetical protein OEX19_01440 [Gammaproteobacteria bacterium]|nr:hypothetical protein [Gammaproteobacteria bacterium]
MGRLGIKVVLVCFLLSGCSALNWVKEELAPGSSEKDLSIPEKKDDSLIKDGESLSSQELLLFYESLLEAPAQEIVKHKTLAKAQYTEQKRLDKGVEYVLILILAGGPEDIDQAKKVIRNLKRSSDPEDFKGYAGLVDLANQITTQKSHYQEKLAKTQAQLEKREQELVVLHDQLNALKSIDKNIHEREVGTIHDGR